MNKHNIAKISTVAVLLLIIFGSIWYINNRPPSFCFNFAHNTAYGDRVVKDPINQGILGSGGIAYYPVEVPALQKALAHEGFYIDPYEATGGRVYLTSFFGPSTKSAVLAFQKKYGIKETGEVDDETSDKLLSIYGCPKPESVTATTTTATATSTVR